MKPRIILTLNAGSSSLKYALFERRTGRLTRRSFGHFDNHGAPIKNFPGAVEKALKALISQNVIKKSSDITLVGHRVVHGGSDFFEPTKITPHVLKQIAALCDLAPLHNPPNLACIHAARTLLPRAMHAAVFDTAFHHTMPEKAFLYGIPYSMSQRLRLRRYGFHGTSHRYVFEKARAQLGAQATARTITCHLGNGCSITAIKNGRVIDTSMGFTPLEGVPMGSRPGDIDPGILLFLLKKGYRQKKLAHFLHHECGLKGLSQGISDVRDLWADYKKKKTAARRTLDWFSYRIAKYIGAYMAALGGIDCIIFTGGIGEHAFYLRQWIMQYIEKIARPRVLVIPTDEEHMIAQQSLKL